MTKFVRRATSVAIFLAACCGEASALSSNAIPVKVPTFWGSAAPAANITCPMPVPSQISVATGRASYTDGFPPVNFNPIAAGGVPPSGADFNGVLCQLSQWVRWFNAGGPIAYDATFQSAISGYPNGTVVGSVLFPGVYWRSTIDNNASNPDIGGAGWFPLNGLVSSPTSGASVTYAIGQNNQDVQRSNSGSPMVDTLPGSSPGILPAGIKFTVTNADASAMLALNAGVGAALKGGTLILPNGYAYLGPGQSMTVLSDGSNYWLTSAPTRAKLSGSITVFYLSPTGSDNNHGLTAAAPLQTMQAAYNYLQQGFDLDGNAPTVQMANGTYTSGVGATLNAGGPLVGIGFSGVIYSGNLASPASVTVSNTAGNAISAAGGAVLSLQGMLIGSSGPGGAALYAQNPGSLIRLLTNNSIIFGATANWHVAAIWGAMIDVSISYSIAGGATCHWDAAFGGIVLGPTNHVVTLTGTPNFSTAFACTFAGYLDVSGGTYNGSATGSRFSNQMNGVTYSGVTLPGNSPGANATGGQYL